MSKHSLSDPRFYYWDWFDYFRPDEHTPYQLMRANTKALNLYNVVPIGWLTGIECNVRTGKAIDEMLNGLHEVFKHCIDKELRTLALTTLDRIAWRVKILHDRQNEDAKQLENFRLIDMAAVGHHVNFKHNSIQRYPNE